jgi:hypothetical protein
MRATIETLYALQQLLLPATPAAAKPEARIRGMRAKVPAPVLAHFDRMIALGRKGVAPVRHGVCSGCHIRVSIGTLASLIQPKDVYLCDNCGCYLLLQPEEIDALAESSTPAAVVIRKLRKKPKAVAVATDDGSSTA